METLVTPGLETDRRSINPPEAGFEETLNATLII